MQVPLRMSVEHISFSAHADFDQTSQFVELLNPPHVILVHGEAVEMGRLRKALEQQAVVLGQRRLLYTPKVCQPVHIRHRPQLRAKVPHISLLGARMTTSIPSNISALTTSKGGRWNMAHPWMA